MQRAAKKSNSAVSEVFEQHEMLPFLLFLVWFISSQSTADLLTAVSNRFGKAFNRSGAT